MTLHESLGLGHQLGQGQIQQKVCGCTLQIQHVEKVEWEHLSSVGYFRPVMLTVKVLLHIQSYVQVRILVAGE